MKKLNFGVMLLMLLTMTVLLIYDFFPTFINLIFIPKALLISLIVILFFMSILYNRAQKVNSKEMFQYQVISLLYLFILVVLFTIIGGTSQVGITFSSPALWIVIAISIFEIYRQKKKMMKAN